MVKEEFKMWLMRDRGNFLMACKSLYHFFGGGRPDHNDGLLQIILEYGTGHTLGEALCQAT
jgi:hypothetical protein